MWEQITGLLEVSHVEPSWRLNKIMDGVVTIEGESLLLILTTCTEKDALEEQKRGSHLDSIFLRTLYMRL